MTQEEKAKKYDEVVCKLRRFMEQGIDPLITRADVQDFFPELKESEDEKIRKKIIDYFRGSVGLGVAIGGVSVKDMVSWLEKQGEQKPADKVEPKFHEGEWITNGDYTWKIIDVKPLDYILQAQDGNIVDDTISHVDEQFHLFTIQDAKGVDVLDANGAPFIYKKHSKDYVYFYCGVNLAGDFIEANGIDTWDSSNKVHPATKKQRDLLFAKMKEAGYEWDAEKKELKKIEQKTVQETKPFEAEHGKYYYCIKDYFCGGKKQASKGDVVQALRGLPIMGLKDASEYFLPVNFIKCNSAWSEEDEVKINRIVACLENLNVADNDILLKDVDWLKSLKQRIGWKPSEEQMEALGIATDINSIPEKYYTELSKLYFDLKKLTE